jgi:hypothetical protein
MKKILSILFAGAFSMSFANAQSTAQDFTMSACDGNTHSLFADHLDNGEVVIMEFFMTCGSCVAAAQKLDPLQAGLAAQYPGMTNFWVLAYTNAYSCTTVNNWKNTNAPNAVAFDSGAVQVAYYGGFGMPTTVVVAGPSHQVIYSSNVDGPPGDTAAIHAAIDNYFATMGVDGANAPVQFKAYPNPAVNTLNLEMNFAIGGLTEIDMVDMTGKVVKKIANENYAQGQHTLQVETSDIVNGIYFVRIANNGKTTQYKVSIKH